MERDKPKVFQVEKSPKNQILGKKTRQVSQNKYFKISLIYFEITAKNLFGYEQIEADSGFDATLIFKEINKKLGEYLQEKSIDTDCF